MKEQRLFRIVGVYVVVRLLLLLMIASSSGASKGHYLGIPVVIILSLVPLDVVDRLSSRLTGVLNPICFYLFLAINIMFILVVDVLCFFGEPDAQAGLVVLLLPIMLVVLNTLGVSACMVFQVVLASKKKTK